MEPHLYQIRKNFWAPLLLFLSFSLLRFQFVLDLPFSVEKAWKLGLWKGWICDIGACLIPSVFTHWIGAFSRSKKTVIWLFFSFLIWALLLINLLYFRFFGSPIQLWVIHYHWKDMIYVGGTAFQLATTITIGLSCLLFISSTFFAVRPPGPKQIRRPSTPMEEKTRSFILGSVFFTLSFILIQVPIWLENAPTRESKVGTVLNRLVFITWLHDYTLSRYPNEKAGATPDQAYAYPIGKLVQYRNFKEEEFSSSISQPPLEAPSLVLNISKDEKETRDLRKRLGLPLKGPINTLILLLESVRSFEMFHPKMGPKIFPNVRRIIKTNGINFMQTYSSSFAGGETVRGEFSTLCSNLPNMTGGATYLFHNTLNIQCLQQHFKDNGFNTIWINSFKKDFHNKRMFESMHGMDFFFDEDYFKSVGITEKVGTWGLADKPVLEESIRLLENLLRETEKPFFAKILTISAHPPWTPTSQGKVPEEFTTHPNTYSIYNGLLSRLAYTDQAVGHFLEKLMESPLGDNTAVYILGDHGQRIPPFMELSPEQSIEKDFRVPLIIVTKNMKESMEIHDPVHQIDLAMTVAKVAGTSGDVTWTGRGLFSGEGSPWVVQEGPLFHYRTRSIGCYTHYGDKDPHCYKIKKGQDPLYDSNLTSIPESKELTQFFKNVVQANRKAIEMNLIY